MKFFKECVVDENEEYLTAKQIGLKYGIALKYRVGPGPKVSGLLRKYIEENNINYSEVYAKVEGQLSLVYPKSIYEKMLEGINAENEDKLEYEVLVSYKSEVTSKKQNYDVLRIVARNQPEIEEIIKEDNKRPSSNLIEDGYINYSLNMVKILSIKKLDKNII